MPKKVLIFSLAYYPQSPIGGAEVAIKEITDRISPTDIEFHLLTIRFDSTWSTEEKIGNVTVHRMGFGKPKPSAEDLKKFPLHFNKYLFSAFAAFKALSLHRRFHFDAFWAIMAHATGVPSAMFKLFKPKLPYILSLQEGDPTEYVEKLMRPIWPLFTRAFTTSNVIQAISHYLEDWAKRRGATCPIEFIPNGASVPKVQEYPPVELEALKAQVEKKEGDTLLISVSRLVPQKAIDTIIRALPLLPTTVRFLIVGEGTDRPMLESLATELGVTERIVFVGHVDRSMTAKYRKIADIFVSPSRSEGLGIAFLSTMAARLPMITTQVGGIADFLFDAKRNPDKPTTGWAVDVDKPEQIASAVQDIIAHPEQAQRVIENAYQLVNEVYNWDTIAKQMQTRVFNRVLFPKR